MCEDKKQSRESISETECTVCHNHLTTESHPQLWAVLTTRSASIKERKHRISREENCHAWVSLYNLKLTSAN